MKGKVTHTEARRENSRKQLKDVTFFPLEYAENHKNQVCVYPAGVMKCAQSFPAMGINLDVAFKTVIRFIHLTI